MPASRKSTGSVCLEVGDVVAIRTPYKDGDWFHWTLGNIESVLLNTDFEVRLWEPLRDPISEADLPDTAETQELKQRIQAAKRETQQNIKATDALIHQLRGCQKDLLHQFKEVEGVVLKSKIAVQAARKDVERIRDFTWNELKSYRTPPKAVLLAVRAVMLLLSEDEARTWEQMRRILQDANFKYRILHYSPERQLSSNRSNYILQECVSRREFNHRNLLQGSVALGPIYYWVLAQLDYREALSRRESIEQANQERRDELLALLNELNQEEAHIAKLRETEEGLDRQLRAACSRASSASPEVLAVQRYEDSFAGKARRVYLRSAFSRWSPTDRVTFVLWENLLVNFAGSLSKEKGGGYTLQESQIRELDEALVRGNPRAQEPSAPPPPPLEQKEEIILSPPHSTYVTDRFQCRIKGNRWKSILLRRRDAVEVALQEDIVNCLGIPIDCVSIADLRVGSLIAEIDITYDQSHKHSELQQRMNRFGYPTVMALHDVEDDSLYDLTEGVSSDGRSEASLPHELSLPGVHWGDVLAQYPTPLRESLVRDIGDATGLGPSNVKLVHLQHDPKGFLRVGYTISEAPPGTTSTPVATHPFPYTWQVYQRPRPVPLPPPLPHSDPPPLRAQRVERGGGGGEGGEGGSGGSDRGRTGEALEAASGGDPGRRGGRALLGLPPQQPSAGYVRTFEGNYWGATCGAARLALVEAFCTDSAAALGVLTREIEVQGLTHTPTQLQVRFTTPSHGISPRSVQAKVDAHEYPEVWSLYNQFVYNQKTPVGHFKCVFNGEDWSTVLLHKKREFREAFTQDACEAMGLSPANVSVQDITADKHCVVLCYKITSEGDSGHDVDYIIKNYAFPKVWALYNNQKKGVTRAVDEREVVTTSKKCDNFHKFFQGDAWGYLLAEYHPEIEAAFKLDQSACLGVQPEDILVRSSETNLDGLGIVYSLQGAQHADLEVEKRSEAYQYREMWTLYKLLWTVTRHQLVFEGPHWGRVLESCKPQFEAAFATCTANMFNLRAHHVQNARYTLGSLVVDFDLAHPGSLTAEEVDRRLTECEYAPLWEMYRRQIPGPAEPMEATAHTLSFEGEYWTKIFKEHGQELYEAVQLDASEALGLPKESINDVQMSPTSNILRVQLIAYHPVSQTEGDVEYGLSVCSYGRVWRLYRLFVSDPTVQAAQILPLAPPSMGDTQTSPTPRKPMEQPQNIAVLNRLVAGQETHVSGGAQYVFCATSFPNGRILQNSTQNLLMKSENRYRNGPSADPQLYSESNANREIPAMPMADHSKARGDIVVRAVQRGFGPALHSTHKPHELVRCFDSSNWNIWIDETPSNDQLTLFVDFTVTFQGKGWDYVIRNRHPFLKDAFLGEISRALGNVSKEMICETNFSMAETGQLMIAQFRLPKTAVAGLTEAEVYIRLNTYPYQKVWALYDDPDSSEASLKSQDASVSKETVSVFDIGFEAPNWELVHWLKHEKVVSVFQHDTAQALQLHPGDVEVEEVNAYPNLLHLRVRLRHSGEVRLCAIKERLLAYDYARVWQLYEEAPEGQESGVLVKVFEGNQWGPILSSSGASLANAFRTGISRCLKIPRACVTVLDITVGSLVVEYTVHSSSLSDAEIRQRTAAYSHPEVWSFYEYSSAVNPISLDLGTTAFSKTFQRTFAGNFWGMLVCRRSKTVQDLFVSETALILGVSEHAIHVTSLCATDKDLVVDYHVSLINTSRSAAEKLVNQATYHKLWSLYHFHNYANFVETSHVVQLKGKDWAPLLAHSFPLLMNTFVLCTVEVLGLARQNMMKLSVNLDPQREVLRFSFTLWHPKTLTTAEIERALKKCVYEEVWALHRGGISVSKNRVKGTFSVLFDGVFWKHMPGVKWPELRHAFAQDMFNALGIPRVDVTETCMKRTENGILFSASVEHPAVLSVRLLQGVLEHNVFPSIYFVYTMCQPPNYVCYTTSTHRVDFEADRWPEVMKCRLETVLDALRIDAATALNLTLDDVVVRTIKTIESRLSCVVSITHPETQTADEVQGIMSEFFYTHMWALYEDAVQPHVDVLKIRSVDPISTALVSRMGDGMPSQDFIRRVRNAFIEDTAGALKCIPNQIVVDGIQLGKLVVYYHVVGHENSREADVLVENCQYPNLNTLLKSCETSLVNIPQTRTLN